VFIYIYIVNLFNIDGDTLNRSLLFRRGNFLRTISSI
jgi:hypothetical protein